MITVTATVEFQIEPEMEIPDFDPQDILNEMVKVKTGKYENCITGVITTIIEVVHLP